MHKTDKQFKFMIIAGEVSGDMHAAGIIRAVKKQMPDTQFFGIGGKEMRSAGAETAYDVNDMAVIGFTDVIQRLGFFRKVFKQMIHTAKTRKPDAVILVDYPGFNLRFAARMHKMGIKTIYYICPQVWAWNISRIPKMAKIIDCLITIFPFEKNYFAETTLDVKFAGHPLVDEAQHTLNQPHEPLPWNGNPHVALLPGSRRHEIERILPIMWKAASIIEKKQPKIGFIIPVPSPVEEKMVLDTINHLPPGPSKYSVIAGKTRLVLRGAHAALVTSGTATIESALMLCPMIVCYKTAFLTYLMGKMLVKINNIGMVNIVAQKTICPEFIQHNMTPSALADALNNLLSDKKDRETMIEELKKVRDALGPGNANVNAANIILQAARQYRQKSCP